jgi:hypothetical protein
VEEIGVESPDYRVSGTGYRFPPWALALVPLLVAFVWGQVTSDAAYSTYVAARALARGGVARFPGAYSLALAALFRFGVPLPQGALVLGALGWSGAVVAWLAVGRRSLRPLFGLAMALLVALHPAQGEMAGTEVGLAMGLVGLGAWAFAAKRPLVLVASSALLLALPPTRAWALPFLVLALEVGLATAFAASVRSWGQLVRPEADRATLVRVAATAALVAVLAGQGELLVRAWGLRPVSVVRARANVGTWLVRNALPGEVTAARGEGQLAYASDRPVLALPAGGPAVILERLRASPPDYVLALDGVAWDGVRAHPWFRERYHAVTHARASHDAASPLVLYRYAPSPFDGGVFRELDLRLAGEGVGALRLAGYRAVPRRLAPGRPTHLTLLWSVSKPLEAPLAVALRLVHAESDRLWLELERSLPVELWPVGKEVEDRYALVLPEGAPEGEYRLELSLRLPNGRPLEAADGGTPVRVASLSVPPTVSRQRPQPDVPRAVGMEVPIECLGFDAPRRVSPGETFHVALYWHALDPVGYDYKVFVHLLGPDGLPVAQHDDEPVSWSYPTGAWRPGDYVRDEHPLTLPADLPRGDYRLVAGFYEPDTGERLSFLTEGGASDVVELRTLRVR